MAERDSHVCAEISYFKEGIGGVHSDLCANSVDDWSDTEYRALLHASLDEFLSAKDATGLFYVGTIHIDNN